MGAEAKQLASYVGWWGMRKTGHLTKSVVSLSVIVAFAALAGCGAKATPSSVRSGASSSAAAAAAAGCTAGTAGTSSLMTVMQEPASTVSTPTGACWASIAPTAVNTTAMGTPPAGDSAWTKVAWTSTDLYALTWVAQWPLPGGKLWNGQTVAFFVAGNNQKGGQLAASTDDAQYGIVVGSNVVHTGTRGLTTTPTGISSVVPGKGYYAELIVPWSDMGVSAPASGQQYAFDVTVDYGDSTGTEVGSTVWDGNANNYLTTAGWGTIKLG